MKHEANEEHDEHKMDLYTTAVMAGIVRSAETQKLCPECCSVNVAGAIIQAYAENNKNDPHLIEHLLGYLLKCMGAEAVSQEEFDKLEERTNEPFRTLH